MRKALVGFFWLVAASCALAQGVPGLTIGPGLFGGVPTLVGTFNPSDKGSGITLSNGNLTLTASSSAVVRSTSSVMGPAYYEVVVGSNAAVTIGVSNATSANSIAYPGQDDYSVGLQGTLIYYNSGNVVSSGFSAPATGDVIGVKVFANGSVAFNKNGGTFSSAISSTSLTGGPLYIMCGGYSSGGTLTLNTTPTYPVPAGFTFWGN